MSRALSLAKYLPAVLCGLLVVAWVVSVPVTFRAVWNRANGVESLTCEFGSVIFSSGRLINRERWYAHSLDKIAEMSWLGQIRYDEARLIHVFQIGWYERTVYACPIPALLTLLIPLAIGCLNSFRFPLWSWFAWTALIAVELAYYLR